MNGGAGARRLRTLLSRRVALLVLLVFAVGTAVVAFRGQWQRVAGAATELSAVGVTGALVLALASLAASATAFRAALAALGTRLPWTVASRVYLVGQLGKYLPGSVWPVLAQMQLASDVGVPAQRTAAAALLSLGAGLVGCVPLGLLAAPALVSVVDAPAPLAAVVVVLALASLALLHPRVLAWLVRLLLRVARRPLPETRLPAGAVLRVAGATFTATALAGLSVAALAADVGADGWAVVPLAVGAFATASAAGLVAVPVPAGAGVREVVLVAALLPVLPLPAATVVAVSSRLVLTGSDLLAPGLSVCLTAARRLVTQLSR